MTSGLLPDALYINCLTMTHALQVGIVKDPLAGPWTAWKLLCMIYLMLFSAYWLYNLIHVCVELKTAADIHHFMTTKLGLSERQLQNVSWPNIARRLVEVSLHFLCQTILHRPTPPPPPPSPVQGRFSIEFQEWNAFLA